MSIDWVKFQIACCLYIKDFNSKEEKLDKWKRFAKLDNYYFLNYTSIFIDGKVENNGLLK